jgi:predicted AlkP superfamily phosphohydrolase/phosphomutase
MSRVLLIGLDAAEPRLIERWIDDGSLPTLRSLREQGAYTRLRSTADWLVGSTWPAFYTGRLPAETGLYHSIVWQPERMRHVRPGPDDLPLTPFWRGFGEHGPRTIALDVPLTQQPAPFNGIEINGWANTDLLAPPGSSPAGLFDRLRGEFEQPRQRRENYVLSPVDDLLAIRDEQIRNTGKVARLAEALLRRETWDLALVGFEATHLCGHKLWSDRNVRGEVPSERRDEFDRALQEVYMACDRALAGLLACCPPATTVLVFALHGMGPNTCRTDLLPTMLQRVLAGARHGTHSTRAPDRAASALRGLLPPDFRYAVKSRLPEAWQDALTVYWRTGTRDWRSTRAFNAYSDLRGYVRVNLRGREAAGLIEPGTDCEALLAEIEDGLGTFADADSGRPLVAATARGDALFGGGARRSMLPDLVIRWDEEEAAHRAITSPRFGDIAWPTPGRHPAGRSGNHRGEGFLLAAGPGIDVGADPGDPHIVDLAPTVHALLGMAPPAGLPGRPLALAAGPAPAASG